MSVTYPPAMLPLTEDDLDEIDIIVEGELYRWREGRWITDDGKPLDFPPEPDQRH